MNARPFELGTCPKVRREQAREVRRLLRSLATVPDRLEVDLPPLGAGRLTFVGISFEPADLTGAQIVLARAGTRAVMIVGAALAGALADSVIAGRPFQTGVRRLGPAERGLVAGVLAPIASRLGWTVRLDVVGPSDRGGAVMVFWLGTAVGAGELRIELPPGAAGLLPPEGLWDSNAQARAGRLPITVAVEIALTDLGAGEIMAVAPGDVVVFEGRAGSELAVDSPWPARLALRSAGVSHQIPVVVDPWGEVKVVGVRSTLHEEGRMDASDSGSGFDAVTVLAGAPIEVAAELGRITLRGDELLGLAPGAVLRLATGRKTIALRAAGELWAEGEIVDLEGELGVRVTRVLSR